MILDIILVKYSEFRRYSNKIKSLGLFLNKKSSEMKYNVPKFNWIFQTSTNQNSLILIFRSKVVPKNAV